MNEEISWSRATLLDPDVLHELAVDALGEEPTMIEGPPPKTSPSDTSPAVRDALLRGWNSQQANRLQDAVGWYQRALRDAPDDPEALYLLGTVYLRLNDPAIAGEYLQQATIGSPTRADFRCNLGVALAMQGRLEEAIQAFRETLKINPDYAEARQNLNQALAELHSHIVGGRR
jgi:tetratricopeptide (TPR) repeat protein